MNHKVPWGSLCSTRISSAGRWQFTAAKKSVTSCLVALPMKGHVPTVCLAPFGFPTKGFGEPHFSNYHCDRGLNRGDPGSNPDGFPRGSNGAIPERVVIGLYKPQGRAKSVWCGENRGGTAPAARRMPLLNRQSSQQPSTDRVSIGPVPPRPCPHALSPSPVPHTHILL